MHTHTNAEGKKQKGLGLPEAVFDVGGIQQMIDKLSSVDACHDEAVFESRLDDIIAHSQCEVNGSATQAALPGDVIDTLVVVLSLRPAVLVMSMAI